MNSDFYKSYKVNKIVKTLSFQTIKYFFLLKLSRTLFRRLFKKGLTVLWLPGRKGSTYNLETLWVIFYDNVNSQNYCTYWGTPVYRNQYYGRLPCVRNLPTLSDASSTLSTFKNNGLVLSNHFRHKNRTVCPVHSEEQLLETSKNLFIGPLS